MTTQPDPLFETRPLAAPYAGTGGFAGSTASREAAEAEVVTGTLAWRQARILDLLRLAGPLGHTVVELRDEKYGLGHHGKVSAALSNLHKDGQIVALAHMRRNRSGVYVLPGQEMGHAARPFKSNAESRPTPDRPHLTDQERNLITTITEGLRTFPADKPVPLRRDTLNTLLGALKRLDK